MYEEEDYYDFDLVVDSIVDTEVIDLFKDHHEISMLFWDIDKCDKSIDEIFNIIKEKIDNKLVSVDFVISALYYITDIRVKSLKSYLSLMKLIKQSYPKRYIKLNRDMECVDPNTNKQIEYSKTYTKDSIYYHILHDNFEEFQKFTQIASFDIEMRDERNRSLMDLACKYGSINIFKFLLLSGRKPKKEMGKYAIEGGNLEIIRILEQNGVNFEEFYVSAVSFNRNEIADWIYNKYGTLNITFNQCLLYFNFRAASFCYLNHFDLLEPCYQTYYLSYHFPFMADSSMSFAVFMDFKELILFLLRNGYESIIETESHLHNPLLYAVYKGDLEMVKFLIENGVKVDNSDNEVHHFHFTTL